MKKGITAKTGIKGWTERRLFDTAKLQEVKKAIAAGLSQEVIDIMIERAAKPMFAGNRLWSFARKQFNVDLQIPYLFGNWTTQAVRANLITTKGKQITAQQLGGTTTAPVTAMAIGTGTTAAAAGDTALETEATTNGGERGAATVSNQTTTTTGDTERWVKTFSFTGSFAITEEGLLDNNTSGGNLLAHQVFSAVNVISGDSLQITHNVQVTTS